MKNIVILSSSGWGKVKQRPHQMAMAFSRLGHTVYYLEPYKMGVSISNSKDKLDSMFFYETLLQNIVEKDGVNIVQSVVNLNGNSTVVQSCAAFINQLIEQTQLETIVICYFPSHIHIVEQVTLPYKLIYDCVDDHLDFSHAYWSNSTNIENEYLLLKRADSVLTTSSALYVNKSFYTKNIVLSKNAVNQEQFSNEQLFEPSDLKDIPHPRICYVGAVFSWFDDELFYELASRNPEKSFVVIGPVKEGLLTRMFSNVYILGVKEHSQLETYLRFMDVGIIPFKTDTNLIINTNPIKMYEYLACGLPVVATDMPELYINVPFVIPTKSIDEFVEVVNDVLVVNNEQVDKFLIENSWKNRVHNALLSLEREDPKADKEKTFQQLRQNWVDHLQSPILKSLYALTYANEDPSMFLQMAQEAFEKDKRHFIFSTYVLSLVANGELQTACEVVINSNHIKETYRAELLIAQQLELNDYVLYLLLMSIEAFHEARGWMDQIEPNQLVSKLIWAHYLFVTKQNEEALQLHQDLVKTELFSISPMLQSNSSALIKNSGGYNAAETLRFSAINLIDQHLDLPSRLDKWKSLFTEVSICNQCGGTNTITVITRPDGIEVVKCSQCSLAFLGKLPLPENIKQIYDYGYYQDASIAGYQQNSYSEPKPYIFKPRVQWIENTMGESVGKKVLDIGCSDGEFLSYMKETGWDVHGVEISDEAFQLASSKGIKVYNKPLSENKIGECEFDCITLWDVVEHYVDPKSELQEIYRILKPEGKLFLSTPNHAKGLKVGQNWFGYNASYEHLFYFEPATLITMLSKVGFKIDDCFSHEINDWNMQNVNGKGHIILLAARK